MKLIIGLGNPGEKYKNTRHNAGFMFVDYLASKNQDTPAFKHDKYLDAEWTEIIFGGEKIILAKPRTFMNRSGVAVRSLLERWNLKCDDLVVAHDDLDIPLGKFHIQQGRGPKVHNGLTSIEAVLKTKDFKRVRIGVDGRTPEEWLDGETYVLNNFSKEEKTKLFDLFEVVEAQLEK